MYETDYQYDLLDNLLNVTQKGGSSQPNWRLRSFQYNSLSRLLSANNPESGTVLYSYDANGNLLTKTDARGVETAMQYDGLDRLLVKTYSDGTPPATFFYDRAPIPWAANVQNTNGRLVEATTGIKQEP
jgi:YD repeat-containing protein